MTPDGPPLAAGLTRSAEKAGYYAADSYFQEAWDQLAALVPDPVGFASRHALLLLKPDAMVSRSIDTIVEWLGENGFEIVAAQRVRLQRGTVRAMWHYQLNRATPQRCRLADTIARQGGSLVFLLRSADATLPASVTLSSLKGPADPGRRHPGQLRSRLGDFGFLLNLVHASDEPADLVRELGILLEEADRRTLLTSARSGSPADVDGLTASLYAEHPPHDLVFAPAAERLRGSAGSLAGPEVVAEPARWAPVIEHIWAHGLPLTGWDFIVVANSVLPLSRPQYRQLLPGVEPERWRALATAEVS